MNNLTPVISAFEKSEKTHRPLLLDGAVGSLLINRLGDPRSKIWASQFNETHPEEVIRLHRDYIDAGADIITTNTFRTNPALREHDKDDYPGIAAIKTGVRLAIEARGDSQVLIAGSNAPAEDCYQVQRTISLAQLEKNHKLHISKLIEYGADFILNETQSHFDEIKIIADFCSTETIPYGISLYFTRNLTLLSGENISEILRFLADRNPLFISFNCISPDDMSQLIELTSLPDKWGVYLNCGAGSVTDIVLKCGIDPVSYSFVIKDYLNLNPVLVGACCGSEPAHIKALRTLIDENYN